MKKTEVQKQLEQFDKKLTSYETASEFTDGMIAELYNKIEDAKYPSYDEPLKIRKDPSPADDLLDNLIEQLNSQIIEKNKIIGELESQLKKNKMILHEEKEKYREMEIYKKKFELLFEIRQDEGKTMGMLKQNAEKQKTMLQQKNDEIEEEKRKSEKREKQLKEQHRTFIKKMQNEHSVKLQKEMESVLEWKKKSKEKQAQLHNLSQKIRNRQNQLQNQLKKIKKQFTQIFELRQSASFQEIQEFCEKTVSYNKQTKKLIQAMKEKQSVSVLESELKSQYSYRGQSNKGPGDEDILRKIFDEFQYFFTLQIELSTVNKRMKKSGETLNKILEWNHIQKRKDKSDHSPSTKLAQDLWELSERFQSNIEKQKKRVDYIFKNLQKLTKEKKIEDLKKISSQIIKNNEFDRDERNILKNVFFQNIFLKEKVVSQNDEKKKFQKSINEQKETSKKQKNTISELNKKLENLKNAHQERQKQLISNIKEKTQDNQNQKKKYEGQITVRDKKITQLESKNTQMSSKIKKLDKQCQQQISKNQKLSEDKRVKIKEFEEKVKANLQKIDILQSDVNKKIGEISNLEKERKMFEQLFSNSMSNIFEDKIIVKVCEYKPALQAIKVKVKKLLNNKPVLGESEIFRFLNESKKQYLLNLLSQFTEKNITRTKTVFETDSKNESLEENLIKLKNRPYFLLLIRLRNDHVIGGFSRQPFSENVQKPGTGCIFSVTNEKRYVLNRRRPQASILKHSVYFLTFGNGDLAVKHRGVVASNFGRAESYFDNGEDKVDKLFGEVAKDAKYEEIEVHQLFFD